MIFQRPNLQLIRLWLAKDDSGLSRLNKGHQRSCAVFCTKWPWPKNPIYECPKQIQIPQSCWEVKYEPLVFIAGRICCRDFGYIGGGLNSLGVIYLNAEQQSLLLKKFQQRFFQLFVHVWLPDRCLWKFVSTDLQPSGRLCNAVMRSGTNAHIVYVCLQSTAPQLVHVCPTAAGNYTEICRKKYTWTKRINHSCYSLHCRDVQFCFWGSECQPTPYGTAGYVGGT